MPPANLLRKSRRGCRLECCDGTHVKNSARTQQGTSEVRAVPRHNLASAHLRIPPFSDERYVLSRPPARLLEVLHCWKGPPTKGHRQWHQLSCIVPLYAYCSSGALQQEATRVWGWIPLLAWEFQPSVATQMLTLPYFPSWQQSSAHGVLGRKACLYRQACYTNKIAATYSQAHISLV